LLDPEEITPRGKGYREMFAISRMHGGMFRRRCHLLWARTVSHWHRIDGQKSGTEL
jgi:hypothetical protein